MGAIMFFRLHVNSLAGRIACVLAVFALAAGGLRADVTGSLLGIVRDTSSAVVPGAHVVATNLATGVSWNAASNSAGQYNILDLPPGRYAIRVTAQGFQTFVISNVVLNVNERRQVNVTLQVGGVEQHVNVTANPVAVQTVSTQVGQVVGEQRIVQLPLNGRSYIDLLALQPGVVPVSTVASSPAVSGELASGNLSVNGGRETANSFLVNGADVNEGERLGTEVIPNLDSVAEFRLITNSFDAEYGKFSGSVMNAITKSGTNQIHGSAFEFLRNNAFDSRNFFAAQTAALKRNQFGYAVGGPAIKDKVFWFTDYQGTREVQGSAGNLVKLPTSAERSGAFGAGAFVNTAGAPATVNGSYWASVLAQRLGYAVTSGEPYSTPNCASSANCVFPGGVIPTQAFSPVAVKTLSYIPLPNTGGNLFSTVGLGNSTLRDDKAGQRVDIVTKRTGNWSAYYFFDDSSVFNPFSVSSVPGFATTTPTRDQLVVLSNTKILGPSAVNEARVSYTRAAQLTGQPAGGPVNLSSLGFVTGAGTLGIIPSGPEQGVPQMGFLNFNFGASSFTSRQYNNTYMVSDNLSKVWSRHTVKFGGEYRYYEVNLRNFNVPNGQFSFDGSETGSDIADYLLGAPATFIQSSIQALDSRARYYGVYAEDSFRMRPSLTLNYGLRWEVSTPWWDTQNRIQTIVPGEQSRVFPTSPKGWVFPGDPGVPSTLAPTRYNNFAPRIGLAYSPEASSGLLSRITGGPGKTSIRAAYGVFYSSIEDLTLGWEIGDAPFGQYWNSIAPVLLQEPYVTRSTGASQGQRFPFVFPVVGGSNQNVDFSPFIPIAGSPGYDIHNRVPYSEDYNLMIERAIGNSTVVSVGYIGTQGHRLIAEAESNPGNAALCMSLRGAGVMAGTPQCGPHGELGIYTRPDGTIVDGTRGPLGPDFGSNAYSANFASSFYNSLQASVQHKMGNMTFAAAYTYSKSMDDASGFTQWVNFSNYSLSRSLSSFDLTHNFVASYAYVLPLDRAFRRLPKRLTQGWSVDGITRFASGLPITLGQSGDFSLTGTGGIDMPNYSGGLVFSDPRGAGHRYFNKSPFTSEQLGTFGNANRRFFHGPGFNNWDLAVHKDTKLRENMTIQIRAEFFNAFNHAQFNNPSGNFSSSLFGTVTSAQSPRIGQLAVKFLW